MQKSIVVFWKINYNTVSCKYISVFVYCVGNPFLSFVRSISILFFSMCANKLNRLCSIIIVLNTQITGLYILCLLEVRET